MSLLHRALKKAERDRSVIPGDGSLVDHEAVEEGGKKVRLILLISLVFVSLLTLAYFRLWRGQTGVSPATTTSLPQTGSLPESSQMKLESEQLLAGQKWDEAKSLLEKLVIVEPRNAELYNNLGVAERHLGQVEQAEEQFQKALSLQADFAEAWNNLGVIYLKNRQLTQAEGSFEKAIAAKPEYADPYFHLAMAAEAQGKIDLAKQQYEKFIHLAKGLDADFLLKIQQRIATGGVP